jgi:hypothetical protein
MVMGKKIKVIMLMSALLVTAISIIYAGQLYLEPYRALLIASPENNRDTRVLIYFDLPDELGKTRVEIEHAVLILEGEMSDTDFGQLDVFPITKEWKNSDNVLWSSPWEKPGGDYTGNFMGRSVTLSSGSGKGIVRLDVTFMVKAWLDGILENHGMAMIPSTDDLSKTQAKYHFDQESIRLKVKYSNL